MKLEKRFEAKDNQLYRIGSAEAVDVSTMAKQVRWSDVEPEPEAYNEAFLAELRDALKAAEATGAYVFIEPVCDKAIDTPALTEQCIAAMKHCARRIKDCASVAGFALPGAFAATGFAPNTSAALFIEALSQKHAQYVFFCKKSDIHNASCPSEIVLY